MTYPEITQYLESFINYELAHVYPYKESLRLERIKDFLNTINNPQEALRCIHVAGTKGKGSTCAFIAYILRQKGFKAGLYTSPHLSDFRERIRILSPHSRISSPQPRDFEGMISKEALTALLQRLKPAIEKFNKGSEYGRLTFFEVYTSLAFLHFKEEEVDFAVLETGLGGRLDATNTVNPKVCAVTPISYEHTDKLGNTLAEIAAEKAGIIKKTQGAAQRRAQGAIVITAPQEKEVMQVIRERCRMVSAELYEVGKDIVYQKTKAGFCIKGLFGRYPELKIRLIGEHQLVNASVAVGVIEALRLHGHAGIDSIRGGLYSTVWPGRCEILSGNPLTVLDGAQNIASIRALKETVKKNFSGKGGKYKRLILVLGISSDKDIKGICNEIYDLADEIILTKANNPRAAKPHKLAPHFGNKAVHITHTVKKASKFAYSIAKKEDLILVCGSLFVVGEFRDARI